MISGYTQTCSYRSMINPCCDGPLFSRCTSYYNKPTCTGGGGSMSNTDIAAIMAAFQSQLNSLINNLDCSTNIILNDHYKDLATYSTTLQTLLNTYAQGDFYSVANVFTQGVYQQMSVDLANLALDPQQYPYYEELRSTITSALEGLYQSILQYASMVNLQSQLDICNEYEAILHDPERLQEYLASMRKTHRLFPDVTVQIVRADVKQEYLEYIKLYGYPLGGIFEMDKLGEILKQLYPDRYNV